MDVEREAAPLAGVTVMELGDEVAASYAGRLFRTLGARVLRAPRPPGEPRTPAAAAFEAWLDEGKQDCASLAAARDLLGATPDVVIAGQSPADVQAADEAIEALGLDALRLGLTWFGLEGPLAAWRGDDALVMALCGLVSGFGPPEGLPMIPQGRAPQIITGATGFVAAAAALWGRRGGVDVRRIDVDVLEATLCFTEVGPPALERAPAPPPARRAGVNRFAANHPMSIYPTLDGWVGVTTLTPAQWVALTGLLGRPEWGEDERFATSVGRVAHADLLDDFLSKAFLGRPTDQWVMEGQTRRIPMAPVPRPSQLPQTEHWALRGAFAPFGEDLALKGPRLPFGMAFDGKPRAQGASSGPAPLAGLRVADFSMGWAGPLCTRHLADLGADVIKVESDIHYDWWRGWEPPGASDPPEYELKAVFNVMNRGKRGVTFDLTSEEGRQKAKALVAGADIVIENYAPGVMDKLGLGREVLQALRPGLVMVSMGAFGAVGPWSFFRAYGATVEQASGMPHVNGRDDWPPCLQHGAYGDPVAGVYGAVAALAALNGRATLGGAWVDLAQVECLFQLAADAIIAAQVEGDPPRLGSRNRSTAPRCVVATADPGRPLAVVVRTREEWQALCLAIGRPDLGRDPALATSDGRNARADEIEEAVTAWTRQRPAEAAAETLQSAGVPAAPVLASHALIGHDHYRARGTWMRIERRYVGAHLMASPPYLIDGARPPVKRPAPLLGEHSTEVLRELAAGAAAAA